MKVSLNTVKSYIDVDVTVDELVNKINEQLGRIEETVDLNERYKDVVIAKVVTCEKHANADKLHVCRIDDGGVFKGIDRNSEGYVQVVCGAPNVHEGMFVAWLPPGSTVPASFDDDEPFVLGARELRGVVSNGMLASAKELAIGDDHSGIIEIDGADVGMQPGASFAEVYGLNDHVIDIENKMFTHRPDLFGQLGVAREIAGITGKIFKSPEWYMIEGRLPTGRDTLKLDVFNDAGAAVPRFTAVTISGVKVGPSPLWLQTALARLGAKSINNVVDATNYIMLLTAQPTHAYDYDKLRGGKLGARLAKKGEGCTLLNGKSYTLSADDVVIVDGDGIVGLGGVMGGGNSEVSVQTTNLVLECANFDMYAVRKTSMRHGLFTDAVTRFSKGQSSEQQLIVLSELTRLILKIAGGEVAGKLHDAKHSPHANNGSVKVSAEFINARLGLALKQDDIVTLLENVEFKIVTSPSSHNRQLMIKPPFWRTDIDEPEDIVEEIGRLYGYDKLPHELPRRSIVPAPQNPTFELKKTIRSSLAKAGANEVLTYSFVHEQTLEKAGQDPKRAFRLGNALSPDLHYYRLSVLPSLLSQVHVNIKAGHDEFALFEIGKGHDKKHVGEDGLPDELEFVDMVYAAKKAREGAAYFRARRLVARLCSEIGSAVIFKPIEAMPNEPYAAPFNQSRSAFVEISGGMTIGIVGELKPTTLKAFKLPDYTAAVSLDITKLLQTRQGKRTYQPLSRYPAVTQDLSLKVTSDVAYLALAELLGEELQRVKPADTVATLSPLSLYRSQDDNEHTTMTFRLEICSYETTLTDKSVRSIIESLAARANDELDARHI